MKQSPKMRCDAGFPIVTPAANRPFDQDAFARMCRVVDDVTAIAEDAGDGWRTGPDAAFNSPANFWSKGFVGHNFSKLASKDHRTLRHLRLHCYDFSGRR